MAPPGLPGRDGLHGQNCPTAPSPEQFLPWARSIVSVALNYNTPFTRDIAVGRLRGWISRYAWGDDYHDVMQAKLDRLFAFVRAEAGEEVNGRIFVDAGPVLDRESGARAGLGWFGKNTNLLSMKIGSFFVLGELFLSLPLRPIGLCATVVVSADCAWTPARPTPSWDRTLWTPGNASRTSRSS